MDSAWSIPKWARVAAYCHENRILRAVKRMEFLKEAFGFTFSDNEIQAVLRQNNPGKPHIAHLCVSHGYAESLTDAIDNYLSKYSGKEEKLTPRQAIRTILESDGVPVLAHGFFGSGAQRLSEGGDRTAHPPLKDVRFAGTRMLLFRLFGKTSSLFIPFCQGK